MEPKPQGTSLWQGMSIPLSIVIAGALIAGALYLNQPSGVVREEQGATPQAVDTSNVTFAQRPAIGSESAPVTIVYWYDYQCPFCQRNEQEAISQIVRNYVTTGKARIIFKSFQFLGPDSDRLGIFSHAVWSAAPDKFYAWHTTIFENQGVEQSGWADEKTVRSLTESVLGSADTEKVMALVRERGDEYQKLADTDEAEATALGITGTPTMAIGSYLLVGAQPYAAAEQLIQLALSDN